MSHAINKAAVVKYFFIQHFIQIRAQSILVLPVFYIFLYIFKHLHHLKIGTAMTRTF